MNCINLNFLILVPYYSYVTEYHRGKPVKATGVIFVLFLKPPVRSLNVL